MSEPTPPEYRTTLAQWLHGTAVARASSPQAEDWGRLLAQADAEQVEGLLYEKLRHTPKIPEAVLFELKASLMTDALASMTFDAEARTLLGILDQLEIPALLLKGTALAHWAYCQPLHRACGDVDILVPTRQDAERLAEALCNSGCQRAASSGELVAFEIMCRRQVAPDWLLEIDIHWRLVNSMLFAQRLSFDELMQESVAIPALGDNARGLGPVHAMLHAAMHRSRNLTNGVGDRLKWLYDFVALERHMGAPDWDHLVMLAVQRQLAGVTLSALQATHKELGLVIPLNVEEGLQEAARREPLDATRMADWGYMQSQTMLALPEWKLRARWIWQRLFPSRDYMTYLYGERRNYAALMWQRLRQVGRKLRRRPGSSTGLDA